MELERRNKGIVEAEEMAEQHHGHHCHHGHNNLWDEPCEDPRVLMYIDDNACTDNDSVMGAQGREESGRHHVEAEMRQTEAEKTAPNQGRPQLNMESAAQYQGWAPGNTQNAAPNQGWPQGNTENAAHAQGQAAGSAGGQAHPGTQSHVHEVQGSVEIAEPQEDPHNHRFATVSGDARPLGNNDHFHDIRFRTDFYEDHFHEGWGRTGGAIQAGDRHVHFLESMTTQSDGHMHKYRVTTMVDDPIGD
jgi:hypothetical protein